MTNAKMTLLELVEQEPDANLVRDMLAFAAERMIEMEIEVKTGAPVGSRSPERLQHDIEVCLFYMDHLSDDVDRGRSRGQISNTLQVRM